MTDMLDELDVSLAANRLCRLSDLQRNMETLRTLMHNNAEDINRLLERAGVRGPRPDGTPGGWTGRARVQSLGALTVRYGWRDRQTGKLKFRTWLVGKNGGDTPEFLFTLPRPLMKELLKLDETRRLLNHQSRTIYGETQSLKRLHQSSEDLDRALAGLPTDRPEQA